MATRPVSATTFRRDGTPVSVPVWRAGGNGTLPVSSEASSWKVKQIHRDGTSASRRIALGAEIAGSPGHGVILMVADRGTLAAELRFMTRQSLLRSWAGLQEEHPLMVAPICTEPPFEAGTDLDDGAAAETIRAMRMAMAVNALGLPAVALPVGLGGGLPQAVQVIVPRYREDVCLEAAANPEDRLGVITPIDPR